MTVLDDIVAGVRQDLAVREQATPLAEVKERARRRESAIECVGRLRAEDAVRVIAEVKRSSPSKGALATIKDPAALAAEYEKGGAAVISVLTEERRFARLAGGPRRRPLRRVDIPVLRKDFVVTPYQVWEARAHGADLVLSSSRPSSRRCSSPGRAGALPGHDGPGRGARRRGGLPAADAGARVIGVNARDLRSLEVDRTTFARVAPAIPSHIVKIAESGVRGPHDVMDYARAGADAVLVGEALVTDDAPRESVADLVAAGAHPSLRAVRQ